MSKSQKEQIEEGAENNKGGVCQMTWHATSDKMRNTFHPHLKHLEPRVSGKVQVHQNHFHQKIFFIKNHFHQKPFSSKTTFIKNHFHQKPISSKTNFITIFIKNHFHQKPISSKTNFIRDHFLLEGPTTEQKVQQKGRLRVQRWVF